MQIGGMSLIKEKIIQTLGQIAPELFLLADDCFLIGASSLILSGVDIDDTPDLDILTSSRDSFWLQDVWKNKIDSSYTPSNSDRFRSNFARFSFQPLAVEVMGGLEVYSSAIGWQQLKVDDYDLVYIEGCNIKIPTLNESKRILSLFGREKDLKRIDLIDRYQAQ